MSPPTTPRAPIGPIPERYASPPWTWTGTSAGLKGKAGICGISRPSSFTRASGDMCGLRRRRPRRRRGLRVYEDGRDEEDRDADEALAGEAPGHAAEREAGACDRRPNDEVVERAPRE